MKKGYSKYRETHAFHQAMRIAGRLKRGIKARGPKTLNSKIYQDEANRCAQDMLAVLIADPEEGMKVIKRIAKWAEKVSQMGLEAQGQMLVLWGKWDQIASSLKKGIAIQPKGKEVFDEDEILEN